MYTLKYVKESGEIFYFDPAHRMQYDLDPLSEIPIEISTSQGVTQVGATLENRMVDGIDRVITGHFNGYANERKQEMLYIFSPFSSGRLYFNDKYYCDCVVKSTPAIGSVRWDPGFVIQLYCAYPFWLEDQSVIETMQTYTPCFFFPDPTSGENEEYHGYDKHIFAIKNDATFFTIHNDSEVDTRFTATFVTDGICSNYGIMNIRTMEKLQLNDTLNLYEKVKVYWDNGILKLEKTVDGVTTDIFSCLDEDSDLFWLYQGDNVLQAFAESDQWPIVTIEYNNTYAGVYDGMGEE